MVANGWTGEKLCYNPTPPKVQAKMSSQGNFQFSLHQKQTFPLLILLAFDLTLVLSENKETAIMKGNLKHIGNSSKKEKKISIQQILDSFVTCMTFQVNPPSQLVQL